VEITIKTAEEFWRDKVSIQIDGTTAEVCAVSQRLTQGPTDERVSNYPSELDWAAVRAERDGLKDKVARLERQLATAQETCEIQTKHAQKLTRQIEEYDRDRHTERDRADRAQAREKGLSTLVADLEKGLSTLVAEKDTELRRRASAIKVLESRYETLLATLDETVEGRDARDRLLAAATTRVQAACEILGATAVCRAREHTITRDGAALADAIGNALRALEG
jgi:chromosome segregation ATPase